MKAVEGEPERLPAGAHGIPAEIVSRNQRERLAAAVAEVCAERDYSETAVTDLAQRAGVSTATFYKLFDGKRDCVIAAHGELLERLVEEVDRVCAAESDGEAKVRGAVRAILELFAADQPTARLLTVEILAVGPEGSARHDAAVESFATRLRAARGGDEDPLRPNADWALVASISALIGKRVMAGEAAALPELEDELVAMAIPALR